MAHTLHAVVWCGMRNRIGLCDTDIKTPVVHDDMPLVSPRSASPDYPIRAGRATVVSTSNDAVASPGTVVMAADDEDSSDEIDDIETTYDAMFEQSGRLFRSLNRVPTLADKFQTLMELEQECQDLARAIEPLERLLDRCEQHGTLMRNNADECVARQDHIAVYWAKVEELNTKYAMIAEMLGEERPRVRVAKVYTRHRWVYEWRENRFYACRTMGRLPTASR